MPKSGGTSSRRLPGEGNSTDDRQSQSAASFPGHCSRTLLTSTASAQTARSHREVPTTRAPFQDRPIYRTGRRA